MPRVRTEAAVPPADAQVPVVEPVHLQLLREVLQRFGRARLRVSGTSMLPALWPGDVVEIVATDATALHPGDLLLVERDARLFCHRFLGSLQRSGQLLLRTRGDLLSREDPPVGPEALLGRVEAAQGAGRPPHWLAVLLCRLATVWPRPLAWMVQGRERARPAASRR
ncbi:MAG TPA: S24/S26 family peptidase [Terriglobales bacterium]|nr:S24/S26 family peptidase [Terriglobales bacterium]